MRRDGWSRRALHCSWVELYVEG
uniref:Uncharacterized protein n=1 Tax=Arundo donax TaxID=35708 RepID=A0A0A9BWP7_ARUDO